MQRIWLLPALALAACSFEGSRGMAEPDAGADALPTSDAAMDAPVRATCEGAIKVGAAYYLPILQNLDYWEEAVKRCAAIPGSHLVTFEASDEITAVVSSLSLKVSVWTGIHQLPIATTPFDSWVNQNGLVQTPVLINFPWNTDEPNDYFLPEDGQENYAQLRPDGTFDDRDRTDRARVLCECTVSP